MDEIILGPHSLIPEILTHESQDFDSIFSSWTTKRYAPGMEHARVVLVPASWNGSGMRDCDTAVDIVAGGRGVKGEKETLPDGSVIVHSSAMSLVNKYVPRDDQHALGALTELADLHDAHRSAINKLVPDADDHTQWILRNTDIIKVFRMFQFVHKDDPYIVMDRMFEIFDGYILAGKDKQLGRVEAKSAQRFAGGKVALVFNKESTKTDYFLWNWGVEAVVFVDHKRNSIGVLRNKFMEKIICNDGTEFVASHPKIREIVESAGETIGESDAFWFVHPGNWLFSHGTKKARQERSSKVNPMDLIRVLEELLGTLQEPETDGPVCGLD